jgi:hypothetical protein
VEDVAAVAVQVLALGRGHDESKERIGGHQRADRVQPGTAVGSNRPQERKADAVLVQQPAADLREIGPDLPEPTPPEHGRTFSYQPPEVKPASSVGTAGFEPATPCSQSKQEGASRAALIAVRAGQRA